MTHCDILLTLNSQKKLEHSQKIALWLVRIIKNYAPSLIIEIHFHRLTNSYAFYISANFIGLLKGAELCQIKKKVKTCFGGGLQKFVCRKAQLFQNIEDKKLFFTGSERSFIVKTILEMIRAPPEGFLLDLEEDEDKNNLSILKTLINNDNKIRISAGQALIPNLCSLNVINSIFPLHNAKELKELQNDWVFGSFFKPQPLEKIKDYFGTEIALYFAWLDYFTFSLIIPAIVGFLMFFYCNYSLTAKNERKNSGVSDICFLLFALFNCVWSTIYLEAWKRKQSELVYQWGNLKTSIDNSVKNNPRSAFKADSMKKNRVTGIYEPHYATWKHTLIRYGITYPITIACNLFVFVFLFVTLSLQDYVEKIFKDSYLKFITYIPMVIQTVIIMISDNLYRYLAFFFNDLENYRTNEEYESFLISKFAIFQCINAFGSLFYIAFYLNDIGRLQETLATLLISRQVIQNFTEIGVPYLEKNFRLFQYIFGLTTLTFSYSQIKKKISKIYFSINQFWLNVNKEHLLLYKSLEEEDETLSFDKSDDEKNYTEIESEKNLNKIVKKNSILNEFSYRLPIPEFKISKKDDELNEVELQSLMTSYSRPLDDYLEIFIQFGYVLLFSSAFPLAALCALINNLFEIRVDAFKLCNTFQRPFERIVQNIGAWQLAMQLMGIVGVFVNCALIKQSNLMQRLWPSLTATNQILIIIVIEHFVFAIKFLIDYFIPDVPNWIQIEIAKTKYWKSEVYKIDHNISEKNYYIKPNNLYDNTYKSLIDTTDENYKPDNNCFEMTTAHKRILNNEFFLKRRDKSIEPKKIPTDSFDHEYYGLRRRSSCNNLMLN